MSSHVRDLALCQVELGQARIRVWQVSVVSEITPSFVQSAEVMRFDVWRRVKGPGIVAFALSRVGWLSRNREGLQLFICETAL
jgi:hypothetical protein